MGWLPFEYAVRNLGRAPTRTVGTIAGHVLVVGLVLAAGSFVRGMEQSLTVSSNLRNVILLGAGSEESLERSQIGMNVATLVNASVPGIKTVLGEAYISPEVNMALVMKPSSESERELRAIVRGFTRSAFLVHPELRIVEGRVPRAGEYEIMVGELAGTRLGIAREALKVGRSLWFDNHEWVITGRFSAPQTVLDAEIWVPLTDLQIATRRDTLSSVVLTLDTATLRDVEIWCAQRLDLELVAISEQGYYGSILAFYGPVRAMVWVTAGLIALGGLLGGLNTMYAAFAARVRELAALQTLGFRRKALTLSFLQESLLTAAVGAGIAIALVYLLLSGLSVRFSMGAFSLVLDGTIVLLGLVTGLALAVLGIVPPLIRCLGMPIIRALRAV
jgi:putative ABC transport system permease protein